MDSFMVQSIVRCVIVPISKYFHDHSVDFPCVLHTYLNGNVFSYMDMIRTDFVFRRVLIEDEKSVLSGPLVKHYSRKKIDNISLNSTIEMIPKNSEYVVVIRLDLLLTRSLTPNDIESVVDGRSVMIPAHCPPCSFVLGKTSAVIRHLQSLMTGGVIELCPQEKVQIIKTGNISVRVCADGTIHKHDVNVCPYLNDLILSSSTMIKPLCEDKKTTNKKSKPRLTRSLSDNSTC